MNLIEAHDYYISFCPKDETRVMFTNCFKCSFFKRVRKTKDPSIPESYEYERLFCLYEPGK